MCCELPTRWEKAIKTPGLGRSPSHNQQMTLFIRSRTSTRDTFVGRMVGEIGVSYFFCHPEKVTVYVVNVMQALEIEGQSKVTSMRIDIHLLLIPRMRGSWFSTYQK